MVDVHAGQLKAQCQAKNGAGQAAGGEFGEGLEQGDMREIRRHGSRIELRLTRQKTVTAQGLAMIENDAADFSRGAEALCSSIAYYMMFGARRHSDAYYPCYRR
jgi:hypothetical protein